MHVTMDYCTDPKEFTKTAHCFSFEAESVTEAIEMLKVVRRCREISDECLGQVCIDGYARHNIPWED